MLPPNPAEPVKSRPIVQAGDDTIEISILSRLLLPVMLFAAATRRTAVLYLLLYLHYRYTATQQGGYGGLFCHTCLQGGGEDQRPFAQSQTKRIQAWCVCVCV